MTLLAGTCFILLVLLFVLPLGMLWCQIFKFYSFRFLVLLHLLTTGQWSKLQSDKTSRYYATGNLPCLPRTLCRCSCHLKMVKLMYKTRNKSFVHLNQCILFNLSLDAPIITVIRARWNGTWRRHVIEHVIKPAETLQQLNLEPHVAKIGRSSTVLPTPAFGQADAYFAIMDHLSDAIEVWTIWVLKRGNFLAWNWYEFDWNI